MENVVNEVVVNENDVAAEVTNTSSKGLRVLVLFTIFAAGATIVVKGCKKFVIPAFAKRKAKKLSAKTDTVDVDDENE